jgi:Transposase DDE domain
VPVHADAGLRLVRTDGVPGTRPCGGPQPRPLSGPDADGLLDTSLPARWSGWECLRQRRCPTGECKPASVWIKASRLHPLIPRETPRYPKLYRGRAAVEREFGRLKDDWALAPLRVRGLDRVRLHADLTILAEPACALRRTRPVPVAA